MFCIPFYLRYRDNDPQTASCVGGLQLSKGNSDQKPGIYYEDAKGDWIQCSAAGAKEEVAFVFYVHRESQGRLEMVMGGFSGKATRLLARALATRAEDFWPPQYEAQGIQVGAFIVQFDVPSNKDIDILRTDLVANSKVTPIPTEALERRLSRN